MRPLICPTGSFCEPSASSVKASPQKHFCLSESKIGSTTHPIPPRIKRGVSRSSRTLGAGCGGRLWRFKTGCAKVDGQVVWF